MVDTVGVDELATVIIFCGCNGFEPYRTKFAFFLGNPLLFVTPKNPQNPGSFYFLKPSTRESSMEDAHLRQGLLSV
jgi:hypothetical protein